MSPFRRLKHFVLATLVLAGLIHVHAHAAQATLRWDYTATGASGFMLHCGSASRSYTTRTDVGNTDTYTVTALAAGSTTYCAVTAYDSRKAESGYSNEIRVSIPSTAPVPAFSASPTSGTAPLAVTFTNQSTGQVTTWLWDFGDGTTSSAQAPAHTYANPGSYTPKLTASGPGGTATKTATTPISVGTGGTTGQPSQIILDNGVRTSSSGSWCVSTATGAYGTNSRYSCGSGLDTYRWTPSFATAGTYDVYVWWTSHANRSANVPITVASRGVTQTFLRNQRIGGGQWQLLGRFSFGAGTGGYVEVSDRNGQAAADAVRWAPAPANEIILDNGQTGTSYTGAWCASAAAGAYLANSLYSCGTGIDTYRWTPSFPTSGNYDVYVLWTANPTRSTSVPITVRSSGGTQTFTRNQQSGGGQWQLLGRFSFAAGTTGYVEVSDRNGQAAADAVRWAPR
jgi:PKD repeat protein